MQSTKSSWASVSCPRALWEDTGGAAHQTGDRGLSGWGCISWATFQKSIIINVYLSYVIFSYMLYFPLLSQFVKPSYLWFPDHLHAVKCLKCELSHPPIPRASNIMLCIMLSLWNMSCFQSAMTRKSWESETQRKSRMQWSRGEKKQRGESDLAIGWGI